MSHSRNVPPTPPTQPNAASLNELLRQLHDAEDGNAPSGTANGRDSRGRFAPGNAGGPGNPYNRRVAHLRRILLEEVNDDALRAIIQVLLQKAQAGDLASIKLVLQYALGKPTPAPDPDAVDLHEWELEKQTPRQMEVIEKLADSIPTATACAVVREVMPIVASCHLQNAAKIVSGEEPLPAEQDRRERKRLRRERDEQEERELAELLARRSADPANGLNGGPSAAASGRNSVSSPAARTPADQINDRSSRPLRD
jgi:hypothetical protein